MAAVVPMNEDAVTNGQGPEAATMSIPADIAECLSPEQIGRLRQMLAARTSPHPVDYRVSTQIFGYRFYAAFFAGNEARSWQRVNNEGQTRPLGAVLRDGAVASLIATLALCMIAGMMFFGMYLLKWTTGISFLLR